MASTQQQPDDEDETTVVIRLPTKSLDDVLKNGTNASRESVRDIIEVIEIDRAAVLAESKEAAHYEISVLYDDADGNTVFIVTPDLTLYSLAKNIEQTTGIAFEDQHLLIVRYYGDDEVKKAYCDCQDWKDLYHPQDVEDAVLTMREVSSTL